MFALLRVVADARAARSALFRGRRRLGDNLGFPGRDDVAADAPLGELALNPSV
jgi:hypothetical protein